MLFNSIPFIIFLPLVVITYYICPKKIRYVWLLIISYFFYLCQDSHMLVFIMTSTFTTYLAGILIYRSRKRSVKNIYVALSFIINVGILFVLKYTDFILDIVTGAGRFNFIIPIGISYYTLQALSYVMDSYRGKITPMYNPVKYALYVSFFPSILSGPINRSYDLMPELDCNKDADLDGIKQGMQKMLWGYFLKLVIAARLSILVDTCYTNADAYSGASLFIAMMAFLFMLYCDFEGYSLIAIGAAKMLGINMLDNFKQPFYSSNMSELWRRWHISLSTWFREYLYFPLGGNRRGELRKHINTMIVMLVSGLWHGANFTFIIWGFLNGLFMVIGHATMNIRSKIAGRTGLSALTGLYLALKRLTVYVLYAFTFIFFRCSSVKDAMIVVSGIFTRFNILRFIKGEIFTLGLGKANLLFVIVMIIFVMLVDKHNYDKNCDFTGLLAKMPVLLRWALYLGLVTLIVFSANLTGQEFIYSKM